MGETPCVDALTFPSSCLVVAPYGADINTDLAGTVRYTDFDTYSSSGSSMTSVSRFIRDETGDSFYGTKMMVAEWNGVAEYGGYFVSVFRKGHLLEDVHVHFTCVCINIQHIIIANMSCSCISSQSFTNTFQGILITDGYSSYAVFIYECGGMEWGGGEIGWQASYSTYKSHYLSGLSNSDDIGCLYSSSYSALVYRLECKLSCAATIPLCSLYTGTL